MLSKPIPISTIPHRANRDGLCRSDKAPIRGAKNTIMPVWMHKVNPVIRESKPIIICKNNDNTKPTPKVELKFIIAAMLDIVNPRFDANILTGMSGSLLFHSLYPKTDNAAIPTTIA